MERPEAASQSSSQRRICVFTHREPDVVGAAGIESLLDVAERAGITLLASEEEAEKHPGLAEAARQASELGWPAAALDAHAAIVLAGDGTLLHVLNELRGGPPVLGVNYGMLGYLSGSTHLELEHSLRLLAEGRFSTVELPVLEARMQDGSTCALNDVVASGGVTGRIIEVEWRVVSGGPDGERVDNMGMVPCDGMVVATPVGSTAYNLSNGGPVMAWGVDGFVVSFIAPHTLSARPLVVAPGHEVELEHLGRGVPLKVFADGRPAGKLLPGQRMRVGFGTSRARLALVEEKSFYARYRDNFAGHVRASGERAVRPAAPGTGGVLP